jgi:hypothetical protein
MPSIMDTPELREFVETHDLTIELPQTHHTHSGFWRRLAHKITTCLNYSRPCKRHAPSCNPLRSFETPMDMLAREHPSLSVYALAFI